MASPYPVVIGGITYNLNDIDQQIKVLKLAKSYPDLVPKWLLNLLLDEENEYEFFSSSKRRLGSNEKPSKGSG